MIKPFVLCCILAGFTATCFAEEPNTLGGHPIAPEAYQRLEKAGFLPQRPEMSDRELAEKLDLTLPQMAQVKKALESSDPAALQKALGEYLDSRLPPRTYQPSGKPPRDPEAADRYLKDEVVVYGRTFPVGKKINWWQSLGADPVTDGGPGYEGWGAWVHPLSAAYKETGDDKYAQAMLEYARSFYHGARPFAKAGWAANQVQFLGPWHGLWASGRLRPAYAPACYQAIGRFHGVTDADRVMFLKLFWETTDWCHQVIAIPRDNNHVIHLTSSVIGMVLTFPEFRDAAAWNQRVGETYTRMMQAAILDDGGAFERTGYHYTFQGPFNADFERVRDAGFNFPTAFTQGLERMADWSMWMLSPTHEFPMFGHAGLDAKTSIMERDAALFPERADFAHVASFGAKGTPPGRVAKVLWHSGFLTMRSDWSRDALYMALSFNGTPVMSGHDDLLSFGLWAYGIPWMTNSGSTAPYGHPEQKVNSNTISSNTVVVDRQTQGRMDNGGRLESWASLPDTGPGITYLAAQNRTYQRLGVNHRRAVLFVRPNYWIVHDLMSGDGKPHEYQWIGHFQPTELSIDPNSKAVATAPQNGKRLWLVPASPDAVILEQRESPIAARVEANPKPPSPLGSTRHLSPYVALIKSDATEPFAFTTLLCPAGANDPSPQVTSVDVKADQDPVFASSEASGCRVLRGDEEDIIALSYGAMERMRHYGGTTGISTDGEMAIVRCKNGQIVAAALVGGTRLDLAGKNLIRKTGDVTSVHVRFDDNDSDVAARGQGEVWIGDSKSPLKVGGGTLDVSEPVFADDAKSLCQAIGVPFARAAEVLERARRDFSVVVSWTSTEPASAMIEWQAVGETLVQRNVIPEPMTQHRFVLSRLMPGKSYEIRTTCLSPDGKIGRSKTVYVPGKSR